MAGITGNRQEPVYTFTVDTPGNRRGVYSAQPDDPSTFPPNVEPALASMIPEKSEFYASFCLYRSSQFIFLVACFCFT